jgi:hypothetical protein
MKLSRYSSINLRKMENENGKTNELGCQELAAIHPFNEYIWRHPKD